MVLLPVILYLLVLESPLEVYSATYQKITFYSGLNQGGSGESLSDNYSDITSTLIQNAQSFCAELGVWKLGYQSGNLIWTEYHGGSVGYSYCYEGDVDSPRIYLSAEFIGTRDLEQSSLTLFSRGQYQGDAVTVSEDGFFDTVWNVRSYTVTGSGNWAVYSGLGQTGKSVCLYGSLEAGSSGYGMVAVTYLPERLDIGSVRRGCDGDEVVTTTRPIDGGSGSGGSGLPVLNKGMSITVLVFIWGFCKVVYVLF